MYVLVWYKATLPLPTKNYGYYQIYGYVSCTSTRYREHLLIPSSTRLTPCQPWSVTYNLITTSNTSLLVYKAPAPIFSRYTWDIHGHLTYSLKVLFLRQYPNIIIVAAARLNRYEGKRGYYGYIVEISYIWLVC